MIYQDWLKKYFEEPTMIKVYKEKRGKRLWTVAELKRFHKQAYRYT
jgi:hypothetical protein